jgi:hypothetical protein
MNPTQREGLAKRYQDDQRDCGNACDDTGQRILGQQPFHGAEVYMAWVNCL